MTNTHCRIGTVRPKASPNLVEIIPAKRGLHYRQRLRSAAETICDLLNDSGMAGYVVIGWDFRGEYSRGFCIHPDSPVQVTLLPSYLAEVIRKDISADVAGEVISGKL